MIVIGSLGATVKLSLHDLSTADACIRILGLDICRDTIVGHEMTRGISGEMILGLTKTLFTEEISTGLDSSTTFQIVKCLQQIVHLTDVTILMSLLQPAPETFDLFDDVILLSEGEIVYQGPRVHVLEFFESCGFKCPERKGVADFLQEVRKDQEQYWEERRKPYKYISVTEFGKRFKHFHVGLWLENELSVSCERSRCHKAALVFEKYTVPRLELLKVNFDKEWLLIKRNSFFYIFKTVQIIIVAIIASTVFLRSNIHIRNEDDGCIYDGALLFGMIVNMFNGYSELSLTIQRLPVFYKHRDHLFYPPWAFTLPNLLLKVPITVFESVVWTSTTYYTIGFAPEPSRFFKQLLLIFLIQQMATGIFRIIAGVCRKMVIAHTGGSLTLLLVFLLGGFILPKGSIPNWWRWGFWISPFSYGFNSLTVNEMFAQKWMSKLASDNTTKLGVQVMKNFDVFPEKRWFWIGTAALLGFTILFNTLFTFALMYLNPTGKPQAIISKKQARNMEADQEEGEMKIQHMSILAESNGVHINVDAWLKAANGVSAKKGMILPFTPLAMSFDNDQVVSEDKLQLLRGVTGAFRPGVLTALMGVSGAGKTTLMDVLAGRKTGGYIEGDIRISGFPKKQETFARVSGYCEQTDIHSPQVTVHESLIFSAFLRLPKEVSNEDKMIFVDELMDLVELDNLKDAIVGLPGVTGLSAEQRKRLTIAVELVANPSILFMDEPTSGLDARAAAIVVRTVRNTVDTGRTVVCAIHQPSIDIFEEFDELLLMKKGGQLIYAGPLGLYSQKIVEYFEAIPTVPKIKEKCNPTTWMLEHSWLEQFSGKSAANGLETSSDLMTIIGALYTAVLFVGINNCSTVQAIVAVGRTVLYRERTAGMYSALPYAMAQVIAEIPYVIFQTTYYTLIVYTMVGFELTAAKFFWFYFVNFFSFLYFTYYGMMTVAVTANHHRIPKWWIWYYWICPVAWTVYGCIVSQYGDVEDTIKVPGMSIDPKIKDYIIDHFGYNPNFMGPVAIVLVSFAVFFAFVYSYGIKTLNFQRR
ncbi:hypothetical protein HAX54_001013 [Datura stramonium]|uniref:ABC transporter domain-containing protein n=1 Tax=Datura stramonium TaxID=4076 RepID=A0ABS8T2W7_DATST|nr:hypothetical protein [Datura stramonium]